MFRNNIINILESNNHFCFQLVYVRHPYTNANLEGGCCISDEVFAERCHCTGVSEYMCKDECRNDDNCRGYVNKINGDCQAITTSNCNRYSRHNCKKFDVGNIADLSLNATCGKAYKGCTIKRLGM